jgi:hypothetical protein
VFKGATLANPDLPCIVGPAGNVYCANQFGQSWTECEDVNVTGEGTPGLCKPGYVDTSGTKHTPNNWCTGGSGCPAGGVNTATCNYNFFSTFNATRKDNGLVYYGGTLVLDIPGKESGDGPAKGLYCMELNHDETWLADTASPPVDIPTAQENGFCVNILQGSCCHNLGTPEAGCIDAVLRNECEIPANAPYFWTAGDDCDAPPGPLGCKQCGLVGRNTDPLCSDSDSCTDDDCTPLYTCEHFPISGWNQVTECCEGNGVPAVITTLDDGDVCTRDTCVDANPLPPPAMETGTATHTPAAGPCDDLNPCTWPDVCDGQHSGEAACHGTNINSYECDVPADCLLNSVQYPCGAPGPEGFCFCTLTPKATFVLNTPVPKTCIGGSRDGLACGKNADCPLGGICDLFADGANCFDSGDNGEKVTAVVHFGSSGGPINGGQLLMTYDPSCLDLNSVNSVYSVTCLAPYTKTVYGPIVNEGAGTIFIACGVDPFLHVNGPPGNTDMVSLSFTKIGECNECELCLVDNNPQNSYLVDDAGQRIAIEHPYQCKSLQAKGDLVLDVPDNIKVNSDCDGPTAVVTWDDPTATFSCPEGANLVCRGAFENGLPWGLTCEDGLRNGLPCGTPVTCPGGTCVNKVMNGGEFPQGKSSFCCYAWANGECDQHVGCPPDLGANDCARDQGGKQIGCWTVEVTDQTSLDIHVELEPTIAHDDRGGEMTRCIKFCLYGNCAEEPICIEETVTFGGLFNFIGKVGDTVKIPKGKWACITAQDQLHTLRSCDNELLCIDGHLMASFKGDPDLGGNWLIGGNLDGWKKDDPTANPSLDVIDILDFGTFVSQFDVTYADNDTDCDTPGPNADINGDGDVTMADYNFILRNFMVSAKDCCCGPQAASLPPPLAEVSVDELRQMGLGDLVVADLNGDGLVNAQDMDAFMQGARPTKTSNDRGGKGLRSGR